MADVDPKQTEAVPSAPNETGPNETFAVASSPRSKLEAYVAQIDRLQRFDLVEKAERDRFRNLRLSSADLPAIQRKQKALRDDLLQNAHIVAELLRAIKLEGFHESYPQGDRVLLQRAIGIYDSVEKGSYKIEPTAPTPPEKASNRIVPRTLSLTAAIVAGALSGAGTGLGASLLTSFYGTKQTCIAGDEVLCAPRNGIAHARVCTPDGRRYGPCMPVDDLTLTNPSASDPAPAIGLDPPGNRAPADPK